VTSVLKVESDDTETGGERIYLRIKRIETGSKFST